MKTLSFSIRRILLGAAAVVFSALTLVACGGGGGGGGSSPSPNALMQGFWAGTVTNGPAGATGASAVVLPSGETWVAFEASTGVVGASKLGLTGTIVGTGASFSGTGTFYPAATGTGSSVTSTGTVTAAGAMSGNYMTTATASYNWVANTVTSYATAAKASDVTATWTGTLGGSAVSVAWSVTTTGTLTGTSSTGCSYSGTLLPHSSGVAVYALDIVESNCTVPSESKGRLVGIATLNAAKTRLNFIYTTSLGASGGVFQATKP